MRKEIIEFLKMNDVKYKENVNLKEISPIKIGSNADILVYPNDESELINTLRFIQRLEFPYKILGRMSNALPPNERYEPVIIKTDFMNSFGLSGNKLAVSAGVGLPYICSHLANLGFSGFEQLSGIPGSIGGALVGNAGAFGREISDVVDCIKAMDVMSGEIYVFSKGEAEFSYRSSAFCGSNFVIISASLNLKEADPQQIRSTINKYRHMRLERQPVGEPSLGSTFKRPNQNISAAKLIDECGLRGYKIGGAMVSHKHAGFIVNRGNATSQDYKLLCTHIQKCVYNKFSISLEPEVEFL